MNLGPLDLRAAAEEIGEPGEVQGCRLGRESRARNPIRLRVELEFRPRIVVTVGEYL